MISFISFIYGIKDSESLQIELSIYGRSNSEDHPFFVNGKVGIKKFTELNKKIPIF